MFVNNIEIPKTETQQAFAQFFSNKVNNIVNEVTINNKIYNGCRKVNSENHFFMSSTDLKECIKNIKIKNCEGYDRIPQRILADGSSILETPLGELFSKIYNQRSIPQQWLVSKIIPIHKKGPKNKLENYRPIANLCSTSKIFERLILRRIQSIELHNNVDITGKQQHGFKKCKSTATLALQIQSLIATALDDDNYVLTLITKWLTGSGLKVNEQKTELCLFYRKDTPQIEIIINNSTIKSETVMNVLGVLFDSKLTWSNHVSKQINKANKASSSYGNILAAKKF